MSRLSSLALMPLLGLTGCFGLGAERESLPLVNSAPPGVARLMQPERRVSNAPAMKASSERVLQVGQRLILANPQIGLRPLFVTVGVTHPEIFHKGGSLGGCQVVVSEGIVSQCASDAELAAVLAKELEKMGANIRVDGRTAKIVGVPGLSGAPVECTDLRGGAALVVAALMADGETEISKLSHLDRGYENMVPTLRALGADIFRAAHRPEWGGLRLCSA